jgi:glycosyltransferase involved in cell wall biosynthesis
MTKRPRLLVLSAYYHPFQGGVETHARELASYFKEQGFTVSIVTKRVDRASPAVEMIDGVPVFRTPPAGARTGFRKWLMIPFVIVRIISLRRKFDLIYCPGYQGIGLAAIVAGKLLGRPVVLRSGNIGVLLGTNLNAPLSRWGLSPGGAAVGWVKQALRRIYISADALACNSREIEQEALSCGVAAGKVHYLPNAVDVERFRAGLPAEKERIRSEEGWPQDGLVCMYVGRLSVEKGVLDLLRAWHIVRRPAAVLVLVGPDMPGNSMDAGPAARRYVEEHDMQNDVIFYGQSDDVARLLRAANIYAQPSHYEAFSNSIIEAMATGLAIVASRVSGMLDCLVDEQSGLLCEPGSPDDLGRQIGRLMDDCALRVRLGERARTTVVTRFSRSVIFKGFADLFTGVYSEDVR